MAIDVNINLLSPTGFKMIFAKPELKGLEFFLQSVDLPTVSVGEAQYATPKLNLMMGGDKLMYDPFTTNILCDEKMDNFAAIYKWLNETVDKNQNSNLICDASLIILNSSNNETRSIDFKNCYPNSMSGIAFDVGATEIQYASFTVTFRYDYYTVTPGFDTAGFQQIPLSLPVVHN
tara:strand:+ start:1091 stop:1618 length:528 start_codon:yes stop_codon:yes gene_type:complete